MRLLIGFLNNATLLIALAMLHSLILMRAASEPRMRDMLSGLLFGVVTVVGMSMAVQVQPGVVFDGRSIVLSIAGLFGGPVAAGIAAIMAAAYRIYLGGAGLGMGLAVIVTSSAIGVAGYQLRRSGRLALNVTSLFLFGIVVHLGVLGLIMVLPAEIRWQVLNAIAVPMMLIFPAATVLFGLLLLLVENFAQSIMSLRKAHEQLKQEIAARELSETILAENEARFRATFEQAAVGIAHVARDGRWLMVNQKLCDIVGYTRAELLAGRFQDITHPEDLERDAANIRQLLAAKIPSRSIEKRYLRKDGQIIWVNLTVSLVRDVSGEPHYFISVIEDITERKAAERIIGHLNRVYAMMSSINTLILRVRDLDTLFNEACRIAVVGGFRMSLIVIKDRNGTKISPVASAGKNQDLLDDIKDILSSAERAPKTMAARAIREKKAVVSNNSQNDPQVLFNQKYIDAGVRSMAVLPLMVSDEAVGALALYSEEAGFFDEKELKLLADLCDNIAFAIDHIRKQERLDYLSYYDELTGLANRNLFLDRLEQHLRSAASGGHKLALFMIDLERFKNINDSFGRAAGDTLLIQVAEWLKQYSGDANLIARIGADHFAAILPEVKQDRDLARFVEKSIAAFLVHPFRLNDAVFRIAEKIGVALYPDDGVDADTLFRNAEAALKKTKSSGDRYLFYTEKMTEAVASRVAMETQLREALDNGEFVLHYQPKVNLASGTLTGAEALIRWNDPRTGLVPPGKFIPVLEETGLIFEVGRWALQQAIEDYLRWHAAGLGAVRIAVNISPLQLRNRNFIDEIEQVIGTDAHVAAGLELEITESLIMDDVTHNIASLKAIRDKGVSVAIDDFGTGFSSLSYLAKLPVDTLKIDRSFVTAMTVDPDGMALVSTIINLAHSLKLNVVAEGVETEEQSRLLRLLHCDEMQGYLFSRPVPAETFEEKFLARTVQIGQSLP